MYKSTCSFHFLLNLLSCTHHIHSLTEISYDNIFLLGLFSWWCISYEDIRTWCTYCFPSCSPFFRPGSVLTFYNHVNICSRQDYWADLFASKFSSGLSLLLQGCWQFFSLKITFAPCVCVKVRRWNLTPLVLLLRSHSLLVIGQCVSCPLQYSGMGSDMRPLYMLRWWQIQGWC